MSKKTENKNDQILRDLPPDIKDAVMGLYKLGAFIQASIARRVDRMSPAQWVGTRLMAGLDEVMAVMEADENPQA